jgi:hypothetical protein
LPKYKPLTLYHKVTPETQRLQPIPILFDCCSARTVICTS